VTSPVLARLAGALIGPDVDMTWNQAYAKSPGGDPRTEVPWHQDVYYAELDGPSYNCWMAISATTIENGTIARAPIPAGGKLLPHTWDERLQFYRCDVDERDGVAVELEPGQAFIFAPLVPHRSGVNVSSGARVSYSITFAAAHARLRVNGEPFGDRVPVLRGGRPIREIMREHARDPEDGSHPGGRVMTELLARAPKRAAETQARFLDYTQALAREDEAADRHLTQLLATLPASEEVLGDEVRARARVDQLMRECEEVRGVDPRAERLLLKRILELAPDHAHARAALARLSSA
jgi:hypothetical protein